MAAVGKVQVRFAGRSNCRAPQQEGRLLQPFFTNFIKNPGVAQLVGRLLWEQDAAGSNPVTRTKRPKIRSMGFRSFDLLQDL